MTTKAQPECPECEKLSAVSEESNQIGAFLDWMFEKYTVCEWIDERDVYDEETGEEWDEPAGFYKVHQSIEQWLAEYFEIDLKKVDKERAALLEWLRSQGE